MSFIIKTYQIVGGASMIHQFHEFFEFIFGGFFEIWSSVSPAFSFAGLLLRRCLATPTTTYYAFAEERSVAMGKRPLTRRMFPLLQYM